MPETTLIAATSSKSLIEDTAHIGSQIDGEIALRLARAMWIALEAHDAELARKMRESLNAEIAALHMQHELDGYEAGDMNESIATVLEQFYETL